MRAPKIDNEHIDEGIDRKSLTTLKSRFLTVNQYRLERTQQSLSDRQQLFIELLPLLFHINHPALPGYVTADTPAGLSGFTPEPAQLKSAQRIARSLRYSAPHKTRRAIHGIYIMGSIGTIGQSLGSDFDVWLCHRPGLNPEALANLQTKTKKIAAWAADEGMEVHFFLIEPEAFRNGQMSPLSSESSGSAQHKLLLDEFYRTAIHLGGRIPLWWFVPAACETHYADYANTLLDKRFIRAADIIDLGGTDNIPIEEFTSAGIWQLYKGIESPYKSVLKLLLLEVYASEYPDSYTLARQFKQAIYDGHTDINQLDPYVMLYRRIENYLISANQRRRLELVRRCFYFKVNKPLTRPLIHSQKSWQRLLLEDMVNQWQWLADHVQFIDRRRQWKTPQVIAEKRLLVEELLNSYRFLSDLHQQVQQASPQLNKELTILGRKLSAAFERTAGKIEFINPSISPDLGEEYLTFEEFLNDEDQRQGWRLSAQSAMAKPADLRSQLHTTRHFAELLIWSYCNSILDSRTHSTARLLNGTAIPLPTLLNALRAWLPLPLHNADHKHFFKKPYPVAALLLVNLYQLAGDGINLTTIDRGQAIDVFNYDQTTLNLISDVSLAVHNSWSEVIVHTYENRGLLNAILNFLALTPSQSLPPPLRLTIHCRESPHQKQLRQRLADLFQHIMQCFISPTANSNNRFILRLGGKFVCIRFEMHQPYIDEIDSQQQLIEYLSLPQAKISPLVFDKLTLTTEPLHALTTVAASSAIQIFFYRRNDNVDIYILDERNSLVTLKQKFTNMHNLLRPLHRFIRTVLTRQGVAGSDELPFGIYPVDFYELVDNDNGGQRCCRRTITNDITNLTFFSVQAIAEIDDQGEMVFSVYCNQQAFIAAEQGDQLFTNVARFILSHRKNDLAYPCYITDLDLSQVQALINQKDGLQLSHYLKIKKHLETKLNEALQHITL